MDCPFLVVEKDGTWDFTYRCKAQGDKKIGETNDKSFVDNMCRRAYNSCDSYKHPRD